MLPASYDGAVSSKIIKHKVATQQQVVQSTANHSVHQWHIIKTDGTGNT